MDHLNAAGQPGTYHPRHAEERVIVNDVQAFTDREAWDAVAALEYMALSRGLVSAQQADVAVLMGEEVGR